MTSPSAHSTTVEPSQAYILASRESVPVRSRWVSSWCRPCQSPCGLHCPRHTTLCALEGAGSSSIQPGTVTMYLQCVCPFEEMLNGSGLQDGWRYYGCGGTMVAVAACVAHWSAGVTADSCMPASVPVGAVFNCLFVIHNSPQIWISLIFSRCIWTNVAVH